MTYQTAKRVITNIMKYVSAIAAAFGILFALFNSSHTATIKRAQMEANAAKEQWVQAYDAGYRQAVKDVAGGSALYLIGDDGNGKTVLWKRIEQWPTPTPTPAIQK